MPKLIFESEYLKHPIRFNFLAVYVLAAVWLPFAIFGFIALINGSMLNYEDHHTSAIITMARGIKHITKDDVMGAGFTFILIFTIIHILIITTVNNRRIVVKIEFDDVTNQITFYRIKYNDKLVHHTLLQNELFYRPSKDQYDTVGQGKFKCLNLMHENEIIGRIFLEHFTWTKSQHTEDMVAALKQRIKRSKYS